MSTGVDRATLYKLPTVDVYNLVLKGSLKQFPRGFWQKPEARQNAIDVIKYLLEDMMKWSDVEIKENICKDFFAEHKLAGMLEYVFNTSPYEAINAVYPDKFKPWHLKQTPRSYWSIENAIKATKWLIEDHLKWNDEDIKKYLTQDTFFLNELGGMFRMVFKKSPYFAINIVYPDKFKPWELTSTPMDFWSLEKGVEATKWLIEEKLKLSEKDIPHKVYFKSFKDYNLSKMLNSCFGGSYKKALEATYPELKVEG